MTVSRFISILIATVAAAACASAPPPEPVEPVGLTGLPAQITVSEWPFWVDIPMESRDAERIWKTVIDVVSERAAIGVLDKESGYIRTEWRPVDVSAAIYNSPTRGGRDGKSDAVTIGNQTGEQRYTFRIRQAEGKIRMGIESRLMPSQRWASGLRNFPGAPWVGIHRELQDRLVTK